MSPRHQPNILLGGSLSTAPNGDLVTVQTTSTARPSPAIVQELWSNISQRRYPPQWNGLEPDGAIVIYFTPQAVDVACGCCRPRRSLGSYRAYQAKGEYGIVADTTRHYHTITKHSPETIASLPSARAAPKHPRYKLSGETAGRASKTIACFRCPKCAHIYERNLRKLGQELWDDRPARYALTL